MKMNVIERRQNQRYEAAIPLQEFEVRTYRSIDVSTHDISSAGFGLISREPLLVGEFLEATVFAQTPGQNLFVRGTVIWSHQIGLNSYRAGVRLEGMVLKPIPLVLRFLRMKAARRVSSAY
jgi:hypothetical protein